MKKSHLFFTIYCAFLTACGAGSKQEQVDDPNLLPSGTLEPVAASGASKDSYSWPSDIKSTSMPDTMK
ncbi:MULTISPECIES: hypothetical protein [Mannheimia]|uniref:Outer membrane antigenic lipoprotein B n=1 Tax=Mannheimia pernigra TaxID=111844 RepID=A0A7H8UN73_9PAST|nr:MULTISPECIES: hypothetical protein [Mannheimia]QHB17169.1 hypothetical protein GM695_03530 [Mannheimia pernigra]QLB40040.1 hypothetical protein HV559_03680 [Mannheimia pernigra]QLB41987.1 hypothetical protein HV560_03670 [Mannheimia pernigra]QLB43615.1 hypothetical protein HV561_01900 [Mannheimia pernigra]QTM00781.1 hypothetical protein GM698_03755 [Mannheimia sp. ZY171111]